MIRSLFDSRRKRGFFVLQLLCSLLFQQSTWLWTVFSWPVLMDMLLFSLIYAFVIQVFFADIFDRNAVERVQQTLTLPMALPLVRERVWQELQARYGRRARVQGEGHFEVRTACSFKSWGESLSVDLAEAGGAATQVHLCSQPRFPLTLIDWGKNRANVESMVRALTQK
ncbi:hypothetical protein PQU96_03920 [Vogesella sp. LYT5W]|uniref:Uncharacterized protein n=1 Tax=Vogesella margarita TaxID=2984199 RepID=A0ABT5IL50_9NEIS|nr:hypothetical protein [Vogesella margarita]MDC7713289.1 hypothetical protein [Vogesella margarita]